MIRGASRESDRFMARLDGATRPAAPYLLRAAGYLSGRSGPEKPLEFARGGKLALALESLRAAIEADPLGALAKAREVLDELTDPSLGQERQREYPKAVMAIRPPSEKQLQFLADLRHSNPRALKTAREASDEIDRLRSQKGAGT